MDGLQPSERGKPGLRAAAWSAAMRGAPAYARFSLYATLGIFGNKADF